MLIVPPHQARDSQEEMRRIEWMRFFAADGAYDEALKLAIKPAEAAALKQMQSGDVAGGRRKLVEATAAMSKAAAPAKTPVADAPYRAPVVNAPYRSSVADTPYRAPVSDAPYRAPVADAKPELSSDLAAPVHTITTTHPSHLMRVALAFVYTGVIEDAPLHLHATELLGLGLEFGLTKLQLLAEAS
jgi:hypothetical protein